MGKKKRQLFLRTLKDKFGLLSICMEEEIRLPFMFNDFFYELSIYYSGRQFKKKIVLQEQGCWLILFYSE